jgi:hypothetical protein
MDVSRGNNIMIKGKNAFGNCVIRKTLFSVSAKEYSLQILSVT